MPRRYHVYPPEFQVFNVLSTAGATVLAVGYLLPVLYFTYSIFKGAGRREQSLGRHRPGVDDAVAAAARELPGPAGGDRRRVRLLEAGDQSCLTHLPRTPTPTATSHGHAAHHPALQHHFETLEQQKEASTLGMWIFIVHEVMFFGGLFTAYMLYRIWYPEAWSEGSAELDIVLGGFNTVVLIGSSLTMALAVRAAQTGKQKATVNWLIVTMVLGLTFLVDQGLRVQAQVGAATTCPAPTSTLEPGQAPQVEIFLSLYFALTGLHALHMVIGFGLLASSRGWRTRSGSRRSGTRRWRCPASTGTSSTSSGSSCSRCCTSWTGRTRSVRAMSHISPKSVYFTHLRRA